MSLPPLEYRSPETPPAPAVISWPVLYQCLRVAVFLSIVMGFVLPHVQKIYREQGFELPAPTLWLVALQRATWGNAGGYGWLFIWSALLAIPFIWPRVFPPPPGMTGKKKRKSLGWMIFSAVLMLLAGLMMLAAVLPMFTLVEAYQAAEQRNSK